MISCFFATASISLVGGQADNLRAAQLAPYLAPKVPTLVLLGPKAVVGRWESDLRGLLDTDELLELKVAGRSVPEDQPDEKTVGAWLRSRMGFGPPQEMPQVWLLLGRDGRSLFSSSTPPAPETLVAALESAGERSAILTLKRFLKAHPDHSEARRHLILALRRVLEIRLGRQPAEGERRDLPGQEDIRLWGSIARELDLLLGSEEWAGFYVVLDLMLPVGIPEAKSPLMKAVYARHRPKWVAGIERYPENEPVWRNLIRVDSALGDQQALSVLSGLAFFGGSTNGISLIPCEQLGRRILAEARRTGQWQSAAKALGYLWEHVARPRLQFHDRAGNIQARPIPPSKDEVRRLSMLEREETWKGLVAPLIEVMVRAKQEAEVPALLESLDESWQPLGLEGRLVHLSKAMGMPHLARVWVASIRQLPARLPREGLLNTEFRVFHQGQTHFKGTEGSDAFLMPFMKGGVSMEILDVPDVWRRRLKWDSASPRWALVDIRGGLILQGEVLPSGESLLASFRDLHLPTALERAETFLGDHPNHLTAMAHKAGILGSTVQAYRMERLIFSKNSRDDRHAGEYEAKLWGEYCEMVRRLGEDSLGICPEILGQYARYFQRKGSWVEGEARREGRDVAVRVLPRVEDALTRWPSDPTLWREWFTLASYMDRSPAALLDTLVPSPATPPGAWPSTNVLVEAGNDLKRQGRWQALVELIHPKMKAKLEELNRRRQRADPGLKYHFDVGWSEELTSLLLEAHTILGNTEEVKAIKDAYTAAKNP